jgi:CRISPR/Cas system-associated endonuclease Cas1
VTGKSSQFKLREDQVIQWQENLLYFNGHCREQHVKGWFKRSKGIICAARVVQTGLHLIQKFLKLTVWNNHASEGQTSTPLTILQGEMCPDCVKTAESNMRKNNYELLFLYSFFLKCYCRFLYSSSDTFRFHTTVVPVNRK